MKDNEILVQIKSLLRRGEIPLSLIKDKTKYRRAHVVRLSLQGCKQREIAKQIGCCISTVEKDLHYIRGGKNFV